jgi:hypothetical protein
VDGIVCGDGCVAGGTGARVDGVVGGGATGTGAFVGCFVGFGPVGIGGSVGSSVGEMVEEFAVIGFSVDCDGEGSGV